MSSDAADLRRRLLAFLDDPAGADFNELALELLGDYQRERMFRFQHLALAAVRAPVAGWP